MLQRHRAERRGAREYPVHIVDGFPIPVCTFARAGFSVTFKGKARYGYCAATQSTYYGFKGHVVTDERGVITPISLTAAHVDKRDAALDCVDDIQGTLLGDKGYIGNKDACAEYRIT